MIIDSKQAEINAVMQTANAMCAAARTAPKACGTDHLATMIVTGDEKDAIAAQMRKFSTELADYYARDAGNVDNSEAIVLIGVRQNVRGLSKVCQICGFESCSASKKAGACCSFDNIDLGIALGSAVSVATNLHIDNRIMFTIGKATQALGIMGADVSLIMGIPLSVMGKSPFFDR